MSYTQKEAAEAISRKLAEAKKLIKECETIADESKVDFSWGGPSYGMGGYYTPHKKPRSVDPAILNEDEEDDWESSYEGWNASSQSC